MKKHIIIATLFLMLTTMFGLSSLVAINIITQPKTEISEHHVSAFMPLYRIAYKNDLQFIALPLFFLMQSDKKKINYQRGGAMPHYKVDAGAYFLEEFEEIALFKEHQSQLSLHIADSFKDNDTQFEAYLQLYKQVEMQGKCPENHACRAKDMIEKAIDTGTLPQDKDTRLAKYAQLLLELNKPEEMIKQTELISDREFGRCLASRTQSWKYCKDCINPTPLTACSYSNPH